MSTHARTNAPKNARRRAVLKLALVGVGAFALGKLASPLLDLISGRRVVREQEFENFVLTETRGDIKVADRASGEEILVIDKEW